MLITLISLVWLYITFVIRHLALWLPTTRWLLSILIFRHLGYFIFQPCFNQFILYSTLWLFSPLVIQFFSCSFHLAIKSLFATCRHAVVFIQLNRVVESLDFISL